MKAIHLFRKIWATAIIIAFIIACKSKTATNPDLIYGIVYNQDEQTEANVEIINLSNNVTAISLENGNFEIKGKVSDTLQFKFGDCKSNENYPQNSKIEDQIKDNTIITWSYYPNPTSDFVTVDISQEACELYVFDVTEKLIFYKNEKSKQYRLDFTQLPTAIYYLKVKIDDKELFGKIIKKL